MCGRPERDDLTPAERCGRPDYAWAPVPHSGAQQQRHQGVVVRLVVAISCELVVARRSKVTVQQKSACKAVLAIDTRSLSLELHGHANGRATSRKQETYQIAGVVMLPGVKDAN
ncbi:hypothetical protein PaG_02021 [Moesziomyces aphidis]|uniref:Uncharacterized protein n=1 Tax=Moesziomyces aphidis TaxID=84754 RepID=W3VPV7_MOEAP|nr:hypothetical protein PaG_02021 [Moesziomyces aphidis]